MAGYARGRALWGTSPDATSLIRQSDVEKWDQSISELKTEALNIRDFGSIATPAAFTSSMAAALTEADSTSKTLIIPAGAHVADGPLTYRGQSLASYGSNVTSIQSDNGQDLFHWDTTIGYSTRPNLTMRGLRLIVDDTSDASASFPQRGGAGNAAIAIDYPNGAATPILGLYLAKFQDVRIESSSFTGYGRNASTGLYCQGIISNCSFRDVQFWRLTRGLWHEPPTSNVTTIDWGGDHNTFSNLFVSGCGKAIRLMNLNDSDLENITMQACPIGLEISSVTSGARVEPNACYLHTVFTEDASTNSWNVQGANMSGTNIAFSGTCAKPVFASRCGTWTNVVTPGLSPAQELEVTGTLNYFDGVAVTGAGLITDTGGNNVIVVNEYRGSVLAARTVVSGLPNARVYNNANISVASNTWTTLTFNTERWDVGGIHNTASGTFTVTIASPGVFTRTAHGLTAGDPVSFTTTGALPTGLTASTVYYVIATGLAANTFRVSATFGGAAVNTSGTQSGTHTLNSATSRLTAKLPGKYLIEGNVSFGAGAGTLRRVRITLDGGTVIAMNSAPPQGGAGIAEIAVSTTYDLIAGQYVELEAWQDSGGAINADYAGNYSPELSMTKLY